MYRIDISNPQNYNLRSASSGISGANDLFIAGGKTSGGISVRYNRPGTKGKCNYNKNYKVISYFRRN